MAVPRAPGDVSPLYRTTRFSASGSHLGSPIDRSQIRNTEESFRPWYPKGQLVQLPGGTTFRRATYYEHSSFRFGPYQPFRQTGITKNPFGSFHSHVVDDYEVPFLLRSEFSHSAALVSSEIPLEMRNEAVTKALNEIADQKVNLGENLATAGQTARLLASNSKAVADALMTIHRDKSMRPYLTRSYRQLLRDGVPEKVAQKYLEYIYGLAPLMNDVYTSLQLAFTDTGKTLLLSGEGKSQRSFNTGTSEWRSLSYSWVRTLTATCNSKAKCKIWARIDPDWGGLRALNQLGLLNPLGLVWDLVPYSFVVDWILPVGPVLYALTAPAGLIFVDGSLSAKHKQDTLFDYRPSVADYYEVISSVKPCHVPHIWEGYFREHLVSWPRPGLWIDRDPFRGDRIFKAAALSILALKGTKPPIR